MCCRYHAEEDPVLDEIAEMANRAPLTGKMTAYFRRELKRTGDIRPADMAPVLATARNGEKKAFPMIWGFRIGSSLMINARSETAGIRGAFAESWAAHRCVIPASYYYEWIHLISPDGKKKTGDRYRIRLKGADITWLAGLYRLEEGFPHFTVLTRESAEGIRFIHDRMPVILDSDCAEAWIRPENDPGRIVQCAMDEMLFEKG